MSRLRTEGAGGELPEGAVSGEDPRLHPWGARALQPGSLGQ